MLIIKWESFSIFILAMVSIGSLIEGQDSGNKIKISTYIIIHANVWNFI